MTKKLTDTLLAALVNEDKVAIVSVKTNPGLGTCHLIKEFAKSEDLSLIDIRTPVLDGLDFVKIVNEDETITDLGYPPVRDHLMSDEPVVVLIDEVADYTFDKVQRLITQIFDQAQGKVLVVLVGLMSGGDLPDELKQKFPITEAEPIDGAEFFVEYLREQKKSDVHLKVADFVEENGLSGANPHQWQLFALTQDMGLEHAAACGLGDLDLARRFVEWEPGQGKTAQ